MTVMMFEVRADLSQYLAELQKGEKALNTFVAHAAASTASLTGSFAALGRGTAAVVAFVDRAKEAVGFLTNIAQTAKGTAEFASSIDRVAKMAGLSAEALQEFRFAASQSGADVETLDKALVGFGERVREAMKGPGEFRDLLEQSGISLRDAEGRTRSLEAVFLDYAEAVRKAQDPLEQSELAIAGFGTEGAVLVDLLARGRGGIAGFQKQARELGVVLNRSLIEKLKEANAQFSKLEQVLDVNFKRAVARGVPFASGEAERFAKLGPTLKDLTESFLPDDLRSSEALHREIEDKLEELRGLRTEKENLNNAIPDPTKAPPASPERFRRLNIEGLVREIRELVDLLRRREQEDLGARGAGPQSPLRPGRMNFDGTEGEVRLLPASFDPADSPFGGAGLDGLNRELADAGWRVQDLSAGFGELSQAAGGFEAQGGALAELVGRTNTLFGEQSGLLGELVAQVPQLGGALTSMLERTSQEAGTLNQVVDAVGQSFLNAFEGAIARGESLGDVLKGLIVDLAEIALRAAGNKFLDLILGGLGSLFGAGGGRAATAGTSIPGGIGGFAQGAAFGPGGRFLSLGQGAAFGPGGRFLSLAKGGAFMGAIVDTPTAFRFARGVGVMGEAGPEAVLPLTRLASGELGVKALMPRLPEAPAPPALANAEPPALALAA